MDIKNFLEESRYIDFSATIIQDKTRSMFYGVDDTIEKAKIASCD